MIPGRVYLKDVFRYLQILAESGLNFFKGFKSSRIVTRCQCSLTLNQRFSKRLDVLLSALLQRGFCQRRHNQKDAQSTPNSRGIGRASFSADRPFPTNADVSIQKSTAGGRILK
jgi:hypothetical protein